MVNFGDDLNSRVTEEANGALLPDDVVPLRVVKMGKGRVNRFSNKTLATDGEIGFDFDIA